MYNEQLVDSGQGLNQSFPPSSTPDVLSSLMQTGDQLGPVDMIGGTSSIGTGDKAANGQASHGGMGNPCTPLDGASQPLRHPNTPGTPSGVPPPRHHHPLCAAVQQVPLAQQRPALTLQTIGAAAVTLAVWGLAVPPNTLPLGQQHPTLLPLVSTTWPLLPLLVMLPLTPPVPHTVPLMVHRGKPLQHPPAHLH